MPWVKGGSGNPGGTPYVVRARISKLHEYARKKTKPALQFMAKIAADEDAECIGGTQGLEGKDLVAYLKVRVDCAKFLATYGMGKPPQHDVGAAAVARNPAEGMTRERLEAIASTRLRSERPDGSDEPN